MRRRQSIGALGFGTAISGIVACASLLSAGLLANPDVLPSMGADGADLVVPDALVVAEPRSASGATQDAVARAIARARAAAEDAADSDAEGRSRAADGSRPAGTDGPAAARTGTSSTPSSGLRTRRTGATNGSSGAALPSSGATTNGSSRPGATTPAADVPAAGGDDPGTTPVASTSPTPPSTPVATKRVSLRLADADLTPAKGRNDASLRLRYAVTEETTTGTTTTAAERAPIDVTLQVPKTLKEDAVRVGVDLDLTTAAPTVRVRLAVVEEDVVAPAVAETAAATDTASNALDVVLPLAKPVTEAPLPAEPLPVLDPASAPPVPVTSAAPVSVDLTVDGPRDTTQTVPVLVTVTETAAPAADGAETPADAPAAAPR